MGQRTQIYVKIDNKVFLQYHGQWGAAYPLIRGVHEVLTNIKSNGELIRDLLLLAKNGFCENDYPVKKIENIEIPINIQYSVVNETGCNRFILEKIVTNGVNHKEFFEELIVDDQIKLLGDNDDGGCLIDIENNKASLVFFLGSAEKDASWTTNTITTIEKYRESFETWWAEAYPKEMQLSKIREIENIIKYSIFN